MSMHDLKLCYSDAWGNHYVALYDIQQYSIILEEKALLTAPAQIIQCEIGKTSSVVTATTRCAYPPCFKILKSTMKDVCKCKVCTTMYCNQDCMKRDNNVHLKECHKNLNNKPHRLGLRYLASGLEYPFHLHPPFQIKDTQISRYIDVLVNSLISPMFPKKDKAKLKSSLISLASLDTPMKTFISENIYGFGLFHYFNYLNHSCVPNAYYYFVDNVVKVRALRNIEEGEQITISYDKHILFAPKEVRADRLIDILGCDCKCKRCTDDDRTLLETSILSTQYIDSQNLPKDIVAAVFELAQPVNYKIRLELIENLEKKYSLYFSPYHTIKYEIYKRMSIVLLERGMYEKAVVSSEKFEGSIKSWKSAGINLADDMQISWVTIVQFLCECGVYRNLLIKKHEKELLEKQQKQIPLNRRQQILMRRMDKKKVREDQNKLLNSSSETLEETTKNNYETRLYQSVVDVKRTIEKMYEWEIFDMDCEIYDSIKNQFDLLRELPSADIIVFALQHQRVN